MHFHLAFFHLLRNFILYLVIYIYYLLVDVEEPDIVVKQARLSLDK